MFDEFCKNSTTSEIWQLVQILKKTRLKLQGKGATGRRIRDRGSNRGKVAWAAAVERLAPMGWRIAASLKTRSDSVEAWVAKILLSLYCAARQFLVHKKFPRQADAGVENKIVFYMPFESLARLSIAILTRRTAADCTRRTARKSDTTVPEMFVIC